ncbi:hypothetical protein GOV11_00125 [Candidatus Woesearchaeota archaeon]|nr:hypothetical protein [Candidatus Woesearchaeota archaeon]
MRKGQLQAMEPIIVVIMIVLIAVVALTYFVRLSKSEATIMASTMDSKDALAILQRASTLPELSCALSETQGTACIDLYKAWFMEILMNDPTQDMLKIRYQPIFGNTNVSVEIIKIEDGSSPFNPIQIYNGLAPGVDYTVTRTYFTIHEATTDGRAFAIMHIARESR